MNTPLLAADEPNVAPSLSSPEMNDLDSNSHLTQMLRGASSPPINPRLQVSPRRTTTTSTTTTTTSVVSSRATNAKISFVTIFIGSISIIHAGLLISSYYSSTTWIEGHLSVNVSFLPPVDTIAFSMDLSSLISLISSPGRTNNNTNFKMFILVTTIIVIPILNVISQSILIILRHRAFLSNTKYEAKSTIDYATRFGFFVVFCLLLIGLSSANIKVNWMDTNITIYNRAAFGLVAYTLALTLGLISTIILRFCEITPSSGDPSSDTNEQEIDDPHYMRVLEEEETEEELAETLEEVTALSQGTSKVWRFILFQSVSISIFSFIGSLALPLVEIKYHGAASTLFSNTTLTIFLGKIPELINMAKGGEIKSLVYIAQVMIIIQIFFFPILSLLLSIGCWKFKANNGIKKWLRAVYPFVNSITFVTALLVVIPSIEAITSSIVNDKTSGICEEFNSLTGESCISIHGSLKSGSWFLLVHALSLETFILLTLRKCA